MVRQLARSGFGRLLAATSIAVFTVLGLAVVPPSATASPSAGTAPPGTALASSALSSASATDASSASRTGTIALSASTVRAIVSQASWIVSAQLPDGAIGVNAGKPITLVWPYLANHAAMGLARATEVTGNSTYAEHAWSYLRWYSSVEQPGTGYVTDANVVDGVPVSDGHFDSTDAYAGTFLAAAWDTYAATGDIASLRSIATGLAGALHAIGTTQAADGLTWATPSWHVAYLMDNAEAYGGLVSAARLEAVLGDTSLASQASHRAEAMAGGISSLWDPATGAYDWAKQDNGWQHPTDWGNIYPDALEQVSAVQWGAVPAGRAGSLMSSFVAHHGDWVSPRATDHVLQGADVIDAPVGYWPNVGSALALAGRGRPDRRGVLQVLGAAAATGFGWPFTVANAGDAIVALSGRGLLDPGPQQLRFHTIDGHAADSGGRANGGAAEAVLTASAVPSPLISATAATCRGTLPCTIVGRGELRFAAR